MKNRLLLTIPLCAASLVASAQVDLKMSDLIMLQDLQSSGQILPAVSKAAKGVALDNDNKVDVIIRYESDDTLSEVEANGGEIVSLVGYHYAIVRVAPGNAVAVAGSKGVKAASLSRQKRRLNNKALPASNVTSVKNGKDLPQGYDGEGVVLGVFDTGIDPNHLAFQDSEGVTRVQKFWKYTSSNSTATVYSTPSKVANVTSDATDESHGTHVFGIMAGGFYDESDSNAPDYRGVATGAELVAAAGPGYDGQILDAIENMAKYAKSVNKPCVMNLSFGDNVGPHDGSDTFTAALNEILEKYDATLCVAAGNERDEAISVVKELTDDDLEVKTIITKGSETITYSYQGFGDIEIWANDERPFEVVLDVIKSNSPYTETYSLTIPTGKAKYVYDGTTINDSDMGITTTGATLVKDSNFSSVYSGSYMGGVCGVDANNGKYCALLSLYLNPKSSSIGKQYITRITVKGNSGQKIFMYCDSWYMNFTNKNISGMDYPTGYGTNSNMGSGKNTIAVGSYVTANISSSGYPNGTIGAPSYFSSYGETLDGRIMPDVCAPGQVIVSARNSYLGNSYSEDYPKYYSYKDSKSSKTYYWTTCAGTSQASPHMAGIAAIWRGADPELTNDDIQKIARETAVMPSTGEGWGYGKVDAYAGIKKILEKTSVYELIDRSMESILVDGNSVTGYNVYAPGQTDLVVSLYNLQGMEVKKISSAEDNLTVSTDDLASGVYVMKVVGSHSSRSLKVAVK